MNTRPIVFDLDGTLIDSAEAILAAMAAAFAHCGVEPSQRLDTQLIGPPLTTILATLAGEQNLAVVPALAEAFKRHYDSTGYQQTRVYPGVQILLDTLTRRGDILYVATNKRIEPTQKIIDHLGWRNHFAAVMALDSFAPALTDKAELLQRVLQSQRLSAADTLYIGDRHEDGLAAREAGMPFRLALWGYGETAQTEWPSFAEPADLLDAAGAGWGSGPT